MTAGKWGVLQESGSCGITQSDETLSPTDSGKEGPLEEGNREVNCKPPLIGNLS